MNHLFERWTGVLLVTALLGLFLWKAPLATQDGPNHKKVAVILNRLAESPLENEVYESHLGPWQTNELFPLIYRSVSKWLSPDLYERLFFVFFTLLLPISYFFFLSRYSHENRPLWVLSLPLCFHPLFVRGMYNFLASVPLTLILCTWMKIGLEEKNGKALLFFLLGSWLAFLAHPFPFFILPFFLLLLAWKQRPLSKLFLILFSIPVLVFLGAGFLGPLFQPKGPGPGLPFLFSSWPVLLADFFIRNFTSYSLLELLLQIPFFGLILALMILSARTALGRDKIFWITFLAGYAFFPSEGSGGAHLNQRFLPFVIFCLPLGLPLSEGKIRVARILSLATGILLTGFFYRGMEQVEAKVREAQEVLKPLPSPSRLYSINFDTHGPGFTYSSIFHLWSVYDDSKIVFSPSLFAQIKLMPLSLRVPHSTTYFPSTQENLPEMIVSGETCTRRDLAETVDCSSVREKKFQEIVENASYYDYWFVHRPPPDFLKILETTPGLKKISQQGETALWHDEAAKSFSPPLH